MRFIPKRGESIEGREKVMHQVAHEEASHVKGGGEKGPDKISWVMRQKGKFKTRHVSSDVR